MLEQCAAYIVAGTKHDATALMRLARRVGFALVVVGDSDPSGPQTDGGGTSKLNFFLVHYQLHDDLKKAVLAMVRHSENPDIRFAPVVLITDDCPYERVLEYVQFGFDDVVTLPENAKVMSQRLSRQIGHPQLYIETPDYLGPDRRRMEMESDIKDPRRTGATHHTRYTICRHPDYGVEILSKVMR